MTSQIHPDDKALVDELFGALTRYMELHKEYNRRTGKLVTDVNSPEAHYKVLKLARIRADLRARLSEEEREAVGL